MRAIVLLLAAGCGRVGFDPVADDNAPTADANDDAAESPDGPSATGNFVVSRTSLTASASFSWVALDVDWARSLAYLGTREAGHCVAVVDFANETAPSIVQRLDPGDITCLEVALLAPGELAVLSESGANVSTWSLGADPRTGGYTMTSELAISDPRGFTVDQQSLLVVTGSTPALVDVTIDPTYHLTQAQTWPGSCSMPYQAVAAFGSFVAVGCAANHSPVEILQRAGLASIGTIPDDSPDVSGFWTAKASADRHTAAVLGWVNAIVTDGGATFTPGATWQQDGTQQPYRHAVMVDDAGQQELWAATNDGALEVLSLAQPGIPVTIARGALGVSGEAYGVSVDLASQRAIVITNGGYFVVVDTSMLPATDFQWPMP